MSGLDVTALILDCTACELHKRATLPVPFRGKPSRIVAIGEAPGEQEDIHGAPFVGPAGRLIEQLLAEADISEPVAFVNTVSCFPHGTPNWSHVQACDGNKWAQIGYLNPSFLLLLGRVALRAMRSELDIRHGRARPFLVRDRICFATYHPAAALRNRSFEQTLRDDLVLFRGLLDSLDWRSRIPDSCAGCPVDAIWWEDSGIGWCEVHLPHEAAADHKARQTLLEAETEAARRRDLGVARAEGGADPGWMAAAWDALVAYLVTHEQFFVDDFWEDTGLERPRESRALGPLVLRAAREGLIRKSGTFRKSVASNMTEKPCWRSLIFRQDSEQR